MQQRLTPLRYLAVTAFFILAGGAVMTAALLQGSGWVLTASLAAGALLTWSMMRSTLRYARSEWKRYPVSHEFSPNLGRIMAALCEEAGLPQGSVTLLDFSASETLVKKLQAAKKKYVPQFILNAAAVTAGGDYILISEPMLKLLDDAEERATLGHELSHIVLRHNRFTALQRSIGYVTGVACIGLLLNGAGAAGWRADTAALAAALAVTLLVRLFHPDGDALFAVETPGMTAYELVARDRLRSLYSLLLQTACVAVLTYSSHDFIRVFALAWGLLAARDAIAAAGLRNREYEADAGSVALKSSPLALITSLRKIKILEERALQKARKSWLPRAGSAARAWRGLVSSHPPTEKRVARLCALAKKLGYPQEEIDKAAEGDIVIAEGNDIPDDVVKHYLRRL